MSDDDFAIVLTYGNVFTDVYVPDPFLARDLVDCMTVLEPDDATDEDGISLQTEFFNQESGCVMTGLVPVVEAWARSKNIPILREGFPEPQETPQFDDAVVPGISLFPHQREALEAALSQERGVIEVATGGGKSEIAIALHLALKGPKTLFICPSRAAMAEMHKRFLLRGVEAGRMGDGLDEYEAPVVVAVVDSVYAGVKRSTMEVLDLLAETEILIVDECHHMATAFTWQVAAANCPARWRIGLSGTPYKDAASRFCIEGLHYYDSWLTGYLGPTLVYTPPAKLQKLEKLARCKIISFTTHGSGPRTRDWHKIYRYGIAENHGRNWQFATIATNLADMGRYPMISVDYLDHGRWFQRTLWHWSRLVTACTFGDDAIYVPRSFAEEESLDFEPAPLFKWQWKKDTKRGKRKRVKVVVGHEEDFVQIPGDTDIQPYFWEGRIKCLIGSRPFDEFMDIRFLTDLLNAAGFQAHQRHRQKIGRTLRKFPGKTVAWIWDPWDTAYPSLNRHSRARLKTARDEGFPIDDDWTFSFPFYAGRFRDVPGGVTVKGKEITVRVAIQIPVGGSNTPTGVMVHPAVELTSTLEEGDDLNECATKMHCEAASLFFQEAYRQATIATTICSEGFKADTARYLESVRKGSA